MASLLKELKEYLRIDGDDEDTSLNSFITSAQLFLENAGVKQPKDYYIKVNDKDVFAQHRLAIMMLATHYYENRIVYSSGGYRNSTNQLPYGLQSIILQLKWVNPNELQAQQ